MLIGVCGKTNVGKSTFFNAACMASAEVSNRPFTTIKPNEGVAYVRVKCHCARLGIRCNPRYGRCIRGIRFVPVKLLDIAGLVPGAHKGRGLGNKFLDDLRRATGSILVVDASGSTSPDGEPAQPGSYPPEGDVRLVEEELVYWIASIVEKALYKLKRAPPKSVAEAAQVLATQLSGLSVDKASILKAAAQAKLDLKSIAAWDMGALLEFSRSLRELSMPMVIAANKADIPSARENIEHLSALMSGRYVVIPTSAEAELILKKASSEGLIEYLPGGSSFKILDHSKLTPAQLAALKAVKRVVLDVYGSTGVQQALEALIFDVLGYKPVFPVENESKLSDREGRVLPDVYLLPRDATPVDLAYAIHTEIGKSFKHAIDALRRVRLPSTEPIPSGAVVKIVAKS